MFSRKTPHAVGENAGAIPPEATTSVTAKTMVNNSANKHRFFLSDRCVGIRYDVLRATSSATASTESEKMKRILHQRTVAVK
ncbi:hypothetical protein ZHAS_00008633 [Anopheles sinensis]|uniref:Uncharacterized protein n=1 Tax=Anopheles sinensis TaxID=74873 RepID=A0A084VSS3_ANOSI|nr:hypothetical protein ZHAS_00008633 [Anopheles sinensis]